MVCELCVRHRPDIRPGQSGAEVGQARRICDERIFLRARQALDARLELPGGRGGVGRSASAVTGWLRVYFAQPGRRATCCRRRRAMSGVMPV